MLPKSVYGYTVPIPEPTKQCSLCTETKPLSAYYRNPKGRLGHQARCIECMKTVAKERRERNKARPDNPRATMTDEAWYGAYKERVHAAREARLKAKKERRLALKRSNEEQAQAVARAGSLRRLYNITPEQYDDILAVQQGVCAMCQRPPKNRRLAVEHDHQTHRIHGLACIKDNRMLLGAFGRDPAFYRRVADFLEHPPAARILGPDHRVPARHRDASASGVSAAVKDRVDADAVLARIRKRRKKAA